MANLTFALTCIAVLFSLQVVSATKTCQSPNACGKGSCCRDDKHRAISVYAWKHAHYPLGPPVFFNTHKTGTCVVGKAQKGELCDSYCECDTGTVMISSTFDTQSCSTHDSLELSISITEKHDTKQSNRQIDTIVCYVLVSENCHCTKQSTS
ncbi:hypothetical protein LOTGIDRAFT_174406 [Lottia gigantea]|uniref:Prokineticin domain-containing protein n=1 Tax=Lottia gigantea TaxID=225164 RepID=V4A2I4_LOTGI|nr:hypothetical protein LOTGIDRAFT_174406 [Lottia gigantea]ESO98078.1 hypothetical protein LOTGIDRAFT_174406 [Lottia gigantea]